MLHIHTTLVYSRSLIQSITASLHLLLWRTTLHCSALYLKISLNHNSLNYEQPLKPHLCKPKYNSVTYCAGYISANSRPHQLCWVTGVVVLHVMHVHTDTVGGLSIENR